MWTQPALSNLFARITTPCGWRLKPIRRSCDTGPDWFNVTLVDYTQGKIILPQKKPGDRVNLEVDILAKYMERLTQDRPAAESPAALFENHNFAKEGAR